MPKVQPTNSVLMKYLEVEFDHARQERKGINDHLSTLNGQVGKNTTHRNKCEGINEKVAAHEKFVNKATGVWIGVSIVCGVVVSIATYALQNIT